MLKKLIKREKTLIFIIILAFFLRLIIINQSLWLDEAIGAEVVKNDSFRELLTVFLKNDNHPPLYYLVLKLWTSIFGYSEVSLRFPSVLFGLGTVWMVYLTAKVLSDGKLKYFPAYAALILATSQLHIYYSQEARMYSQAAFLASVCMYSFINLLSKITESKKYWIIFSVSITALVFTDYVPVFLIPVFWIGAIYFRKDTLWLKKFMISQLPILFIGIFWLPVFLIQSQKGKWLLSTLPGWKTVAGGATFKQAVLVWMKFVFGRISLENKSVYYFLTFISSIPYVFSILKAFKKPKKGIFLVFFWLAVPLFTGFIASFYFPAFIYFRFLYVIPAFYIISTWGTFQFRSDLRNILLISIISFNILSFFIYILDERQQREKWREATKFVESRARANEIVIFEYPEEFTPYRWYRAGGISSAGATDFIYANPEKTIKKTEIIIKDKEGIYYFEYLRDLSDPARIVENSLRKNNFIVKEVYNFQGVGQIFYWTK